MGNGGKVENTRKGIFGGKKVSRCKYRAITNRAWSYQYIIVETAQGHGIFDSGVKAPNLYSEVLNFTKNLHLFIVNL